MIVIGIGNRLLMDDGIGVALVEELQKENQDETLEYIVGETDLDFCLDAIEDASECIVIDAVKMGMRPGEVNVYDFKELTLMELGCSAHNLHFFHFLHHKRDERKVFVIGIEPFQIDYHLGLSPFLQDRFQQILINVKDYIQKIKKNFYENNP